jgi:hypothetical protein
MCEQDSSGSPEESSVYNLPTLFEREVGGGRAGNEHPRDRLI